MTARRLRAAALAGLGAIALVGCFDGGSGKVVDEARRAGRVPESFVAAHADYFRDMDQRADGRLELEPREIEGRNTWLVWTGGNDRMWDRITSESFGDVDLLKTLSSHRDRSGKYTLGFGRKNRWETMGLVNEPCFTEATGPDPKRHGLWLDQRIPDCGPDPFENETSYPGVRIGARGKEHLPVGSSYGYATGIVGLRLFPNPDFDEAAERRWNAEKYHTDRDYSKNLVKPYRVGMSCAFCHVGPNPLKPPADPENPRWENLSSTVGAQYMRFDRVFAWRWDVEKADKRRNFVYELFRSTRPGALDTSLIPTDNINNPRTMNALYHLGPRLHRAKTAGREELAGGGLDSKQFNDYAKEGLPADFFSPPSTVWTPRILKDGADSVGALAALNRVFINIGVFSEEWLLHFKPIVGGRSMTPIEVSVARRRSAYWQATEAQTPNMALFLLKSTAPHRLEYAPGGAEHLKADEATLTRGKVVFAENCARCHSSKLPDLPPKADPGACAGPDYLNCWNGYLKWTGTPEFKQAMREIVLARDFLEDNYLSSEYRVPVTLLQTNACSPLASNAIAGNVWDNFSSQSYKTLPLVSPLRVYRTSRGEEPYGEPYAHEHEAAGGRGYTRPPSLVSLWSTAPFLLNNSVGTFEGSPSVEARMKSFNDSIEQMLWPEKRERDTVLKEKVPGVVDRTNHLTYLQVEADYLPEGIAWMPKALHPVVPWLFSETGILIGPIPAGTPVSLLANIDLRSENTHSLGRIWHTMKVGWLLLNVRYALKSLPKEPPEGAAALDAFNVEVRKAFTPVAPMLVEFSKCRDFVVNRGHYFATGYAEPGAGPSARQGLSDADKRALIEFLKTF